MEGCREGEASVQETKSPSLGQMLQNMIAFLGGVGGGGRWNKWHKRGEARTLVDRNDDEAICYTNFC